MVLYQTLPNGTIEPEARPLKPYLLRTLLEESTHLEKKLTIYAILKSTDGEVELYSQLLKRAVV